MNDHTLVALALGLALAGCEAKSSEARARPAKVRWFGALRAIMHERRTDAAVRSRSKGSVDHADHARSAVRGVVEQANARLIGFFSSVHQGVFTHAGSRSHFHALVEDQRVSGHVDGMVLKPGARLLLAR